MTNKEAIDYIKLIFVRDRANELHFISHDEEIALNLAIKALEEKPQDDLIKAFELLKAYCKNRECDKDCVFYRELRIGDNIDHQYCGLCEIVASDDKEAEND